MPSGMQSSENESFGKWQSSHLKDDIRHGRCEGSDLSSSSFWACRALLPPDLSVLTGIADPGVTSRPELAVVATPPPVRASCVERGPGVDRQDGFRTHSLVLPPSLPLLAPAVSRDLWSRGHRATLYLLHQTRPTSRRSLRSRWKELSKRIRTDTCPPHRALHGNPSAREHGSL